MLNDPWFHLQLGLALSGFAGVFFYYAYFMSKRGGKLSLSATGEKLFLNTVVNIPLCVVWYVMPFLPQPMLSQIRYKQTAELFASSPVPWSEFSYLYAPGNYILADWARVTVGLVIFASALYCMFRFLKENTSVTSGDYAAPKKLLATGVYRHIRHPGLAAQFFAVAGLTVMTGGFYTVMVLALHMIALLASALVEERLVLAPLFGEEFKAYRMQTPAFRCRIVTAAGLAVNAALYAAYFLPNHILPA